MANILCIEPDDLNAIWIKRYLELIAKPAHQVSTVSTVQDALAYQPDYELMIVDETIWLSRMDIVEVIRQKYPDAVFKVLLFSALTLDELRIRQEQDLLRWGIDSYLFKPDINNMSTGLIPTVQRLLQP